jgi:hypothetical protein
MAGAGDLRDAYWPNFDDTATVREGRTLVVQYADIASGGGLTTPTGGCTFASVNTWAAPQVACRPAVTGTDECVVSWRDNSVAGQSFSFIDTPTNLGTACSVSATYQSSWRADGPVDIAWGAGERAVGIGIRPPDVSTRPGELTIFRVLPTGLESQLFVAQELGLSVGNATVSSHMEPRIAYHETSNRYVVAYVDFNTNVRLLSLNAEGRPLSTTSTIIGSLDTSYDSLLPPQIVCDTHAALTYSFCYLYVQPTSPKEYIKGGGFIRDIVSFSGDGSLSIQNLPNEASAQVDLLIDGGTFGAGRVSGQPTTDGFWMNTKPSPITTSSEVRFVFDDVGFFNSSQSSYTNSYLSLSAFNSLGRRANVSAFDWNERIARFVIVTAKD